MGFGWDLEAVSIKKESSCGQCASLRLGRLVRGSLRDGQSRDARIEFVTAFSGSWGSSGVFDSGRIDSFLH